ncbi:probable serine/threonine-protein kinase nek3 isoform X2 [Lucilia sericata]|uniref:probable serine/threonine-protein kinase nek3 isoform X2 n=1 Tax=Lucilia sericata TaxID=13632 RepID=UPI0018A84BCB|nr:probable serine/threonine-protein kinase nek3 isoform X2 [Lucilia sericata]XP_037817395.1 probable serine/threonine-protein kinase nek3 isoform X2 [Lucilia sericata]XP_037817396.1 probable serine/threonine-protein kinase nek3 isoform X2 [Lucilia sericata]
MGSLNGDVMVMRNGRSTSQVSVYNYPEHLNPFYEDDQHKRLRFWKISKKDNEGRRNSFSIGNLKDMWAFKSFRMKKKSSTLGINKTSESPPTLRRDYVVDNGWNTFDHRLRGSNTSSINGDSFQRNATYRSSLQTLPTSNDRIGLNRNDGYRSTIQVTRSNPRYQPQQKQQQLQQQHNTTGVSQNRRSSQSSMVSTNPFESDDDENEDINSSCMRSVNGGSTTTLTSRTPRKKRRAPAPPTPTHGRSNGAPPPTILIESSHDNTQDELRIREDIDIANLTAEIESFVKTKDNDDVEVAPKDEVQTVTTTSTTETETSTNNVEKLKVEEEQEIKPAAKETSQTTTSTTVVSDIPTKENVITATKTNGQVTTEIVTVTTTTKTTTTDVNKLLEKETKVAQVSNETVIKTDDSKEIKSNGAIPKKSNNMTVVSSSVEQQQPQTAEVVTDLCIKETNSQEVSQKPVPLKRHTKPEAEAEVGHVECIHVHVESPRATPRKEHPSGVSSFKTNENVEVNETITTKTPFVLTSPPTQRRKPPQTESEPVIKETVKIVGTSSANERTNHELTIKEERINAKPEILVKPTLSPKPVTKDVNGKVHGFAEIHKPARKFTNNQNGHVRRASRDESVTPPTVPQEKNHTQEEKKINNSVPSHISIKTNGEKAEEVKVPEVKKVETLKIVETTTSSTTNGETKSMEKEETKELKKVNFETSINNTNTVTTPELQRQTDEFDLLYRPKPANHMEWKRSTLAPLETNIPPEKRKSVKDIIESINRSQRLLNAAANKDFTALQTQNTITPNNNTSGPQSITTQQTSENKHNGNLSENLKILDEIQKEIEEMIPSATEGAAANSPSPSPSNCNNEYSEAQKLDNNDIFQKCKVKKEVYDYRESSPISSNLDWNPVPKPKRTKPGHE